MAQRVSPIGKTSGSRPPEASRRGAAEAAARPRRDVIEILWVLFCSIRFAVVLNVALAMAAMLGTIIPQMQPGTQNIDSALSQFLDQAHSRYGDLSGLLYWAGFYDLYNSLWFRMLVVIVVFSIVICTLNRWQPIVRLITRPTVRSSDSFLSSLSERAQFTSVPLDMPRAEEALRSALKKGRYRVLAEQSPGGDTLFLYADRDRWSKMVTFVSHAALVLLILTAAGLMNTGWREQSVYFYPGQPVAIGHGTTWQVRSDQFAIEYYADGQSIKEFKDTLTVSEGNKDVLTKTIIVNDPLHYKGITYFLVSYQPVLFATVRDASGNKLSLRTMGGPSGPQPAKTNSSGEALMEFSNVNSDNLPEDIIQLPAGQHFLTLDMVYYQDVARAAGENAPVLVTAYLDQNFDTPLYRDFLPRTGPLRIPGYAEYAFSFRKDTATVLEIAKDPGLGLIGAFFIVMTLGFTLSLYTTFTRCWGKIVRSTADPGSVDIVLGGLAEKNKVSFERDFEKLAHRARNALATAAKAHVGFDDVTAGTGSEQPAP